VKGMELVTTGLEDRLFEELNNTKESIIIISPFISLSTAERLSKLQNDNVKCRMITRFDRNLFINGSSSIRALKLLVRHGIEIVALKDLHSKVYVFDNKTCMVGSANFTKKGLNVNKELLMFLNEPIETLPILNYVKELTREIEMDGDWVVSEEMIDIELNIKKHYKAPKDQDPRLNYSWGAELKDKKLDEEEIVLSVSIGGTYDIVEKYAIHAHPNHYNYKTTTNYITFRYPNGGQMKHVYEIVETLEIDISGWETEIRDLNFSDRVKSRLENYIIDRSKGFNYERSGPYKFYILKERIELPNGPRPLKNNAGGWYYRLGNLIDSEDGIVHTVKI
jgi:HKD family nuclease